MTLKSAFIIPSLNTAMKSRNAQGFEVILIKAHDDWNLKDNINNELSPLWPEIFHTGVGKATQK